MSKNPQLRHWVHTVWPKHLGLDEEHSDVEIYEEFQRYWRSLQDSPGLRWLNGQIERSPDTGCLHIQAYSEWKVSKRRSEVAKIIPSHVEARKGSREDARDYCRSKTWRGKEKGQVLVLPDIGEWRKETRTVSESPKQRAIGMLKQGFTPEQILQHDVECYFTHFRAIQHIYSQMLASGITLSTEEE